MSANDQLFARFGKACVAGTVLFREGDSGDCMYVIQTGRIRISKEIPGGQNTVAVLGPGEFLGEMAILNSKPRTATAEVLEDAKLLVIDPRTFEAMIANNMEVAVRMIKKLAARLDAADSLIKILLHTDPKARVILGIAREAEFHGTQREDGSVLVALDGRELAERVGLSPAEVEAVVRRLTRLGMVEETEIGYAVTDIGKLHDFLEFLEGREKTSDGS